MKKYLASVLLLLIAPGICFGASARYTQLVREKQRKMEQLEKCMGTNKGLQIAGISTLGLTAVGVAGNIAEANIIKKNDKTLEKQNTTLAEKEEEYNRKENARKDAEQERDDAKENWKNAHKLREIVIKDTNDINSLNVTIGTRVVVHGYDPSALPAGELKNNLASAIINAIVKCKNLENHNGIKTVSLQDGDKPTWGNTSGNLDLEAVWTDLTEREIMVCNLVDCETNGYTKSGNACIPNGADCLDEIKTREPKATAAKKDSDGVCRIISCSEGNPSDDRQRCIRSLPGTPTTPNGDDDSNSNDNGNGDGGGNDGIPDDSRYCTQEFKTQNHATEVADCPDAAACCIKSCETGYYTALFGTPHDVSYDLYRDVQCVKNTLVREGGACVDADLKKSHATQGIYRKGTDGKLHCYPIKCDGQNGYELNKYICQKKRQKPTVCHTALGDLKIGEYKYVTKDQCQGELKDKRTSRWKKEEETQWSMTCQEGAKLVCMAQDCLQSAYMFIDQQTNKCETKFCRFAKQCKAKGGRYSCATPVRQKGKYGYVVPEPNYTGGTAVCVFDVIPGGLLSLQGSDCEGIDFLKQEFDKGEKMNDVIKINNEETKDKTIDNACISGLGCYGDELSNYKCEL